MSDEPLPKSDFSRCPLVLCAEVLDEKQASKPLCYDNGLNSGDVRSLSLVKPQGFLSPESKGCVMQLFDYFYGVSQAAECGSDQPLEDRSPVTFFMAHHPSILEDFRHFRLIDCECGFLAKESLVVLRGLEENPIILGLLEMLSSFYLERLGRHSDVIINKSMASYGSSGWHGG